MLFSYSKIVFSRSCKVSFNITVRTPRRRENLGKNQRKVILATYQFKRVPFGTKNSMSALARCLDTILGEDLTAFVNIYADDLIIYSESFEKHLIHTLPSFFFAVTSGLRKRVFAFSMISCCSESSTSLIPDYRSVPNIDELFNNFGKAKYFSSV